MPYGCRPPWCYKGATVTYNRTAAAATVIVVHPPIPGDVSSFVAVRFADGVERETTLDAISERSASSAAGGGSGGGGSSSGDGGGGAAAGNGGGVHAAAASTVATDAERAQLLSLGINEEQLVEMNALPAAEYVLFFLSLSLSFLTIPPQSPSVTRPKHHPSQYSPHQASVAIFRSIGSPAYLRPR